jgi:UDP-N-acetylmuramoyl-tripeptide--D-alanyl-D-alanine ligase
VVEIGMNNPGEIAPLARMARPHVACVTAIGEAHIGHMGGLEAIAEEKGSIAAGSSPAGTAVLNRDTPFFDRLAAIALGPAPPGSSASAARRRPRRGCWRPRRGRGDPRATIRVGGRDVVVAMPGAMGLHHAMNACAALAVVAALGEDPARAAEALRGYDPGAGRGAARPRRPARRRRGDADRRELQRRGACHARGARHAGAAPCRRAPHRRPGRHARARRLLRRAARGPSARRGRGGRPGLLLRAGDGAAPRPAAARRRGAHAPDSTALAPLVREALRPGDVVLVKGALGSRMAVVVRALTAGAGGGQDGTTQTASGGPAP